MKLYPYRAHILQDTHPNKEKWCQYRVNFIAQNFSHTNVFYDRNKEQTEKEEVIKQIQDNLFSEQECLDRCIFSDEFKVQESITPNRKLQVVWSRNKEDAVVFPQKNFPKSFMVSVTFSRKHLVQKICEENVDNTWFTGEVIPTVIDDIVNGKFGVDIDTGIFIHDMCSPYATPDTQQLIENYFPIKTFKYHG